MSGLWRYLFRDNPMQIETLRAIRRFTVTSGRTTTIQRNVARALVGLLCFLYAWFLFTIVSYHEDISAAILWFEFVVLTLLVPGSLYESISGERERLTWDSLILTNLSPARILIGKLLWRLGMAASIMLILLVPLLLSHNVSTNSVAYTLPNLLLIQAIFACWCVFLALFTLWLSARTKRPVITLSVVTVFLLTVLVLGPTLVMLFGGTPIVPIAPGVYRPEQLGSTRSLTQMAYLGSLFFHMNPGYIIGALDSASLHNVSYDFGRDFLASAPSGDTPESGIGIFHLLPAIWLGLAALCLRGTVKALARLGLPSGGAR